MVFSLQHKIQGSNISTIVFAYINDHREKKMKLRLIAFIALALLFALTIGNLSCAGKDDDDYSGVSLDYDDDDDDNANANDDDDDDDDDNDTAIVCSGNEDCDDNAFCNGAETCVYGQCIPGDPPCNDDEVFCNGSEFCDEAADFCDHTGDPCADDGAFCNGSEFCDEAGETCDHTGDPCPIDGAFCNGNEYCDEPGDQCLHTGDPCNDDGAFCNGNEYCDEGNDLCDHTGDPCPLIANCDEIEDGCYLYDEVELAADDGDPEDYWAGLDNGCIAVQGFVLSPEPMTLVSVRWLSLSLSYFGNNPVRLVVYHNDVAGFAPIDPPVYRSDEFAFDLVFSWEIFSLAFVPQFADPFEGGELFIGFEWTQLTPYPEESPDLIGPYLAADEDSAPGTRSWVYTLYSWETLEYYGHPGAWVVRPTFESIVYLDDDDTDLDEDFTESGENDAPELSSTTLPNFISFRGQAYDNSAQSAGRNAKLAEEVWYNEQGGPFPSYTDQLSDLLTVDHNLNDDPNVTFAFGVCNSSGFILWTEHALGTGYQFEYHD